MKKHIKTASAFLLSACVFLACSYLYLHTNLEGAKKPVGEKQENVPYFEVPDNCGLLFLLPHDMKILFFLDFDSEISYIINIDNNTGAVDGFSLYPTDYVFNLDYYTLSAVIDRLGGLNLQIGEETLRFTGIQVCDILLEGSDPKLGFNVAAAVCERLGSEGFSKDDFVFLIENSDTELTVPVCLYWIDRIATLFGNAVFVDWEI